MSDFTEIATDACCDRNEIINQLTNDNNCMKACETSKRIEACECHKIPSSVCKASKGAE